MNKFKINGKESILFCSLFSKNKSKEIAEIIVDTEDLIYLLRETWECDIDYNSNLKVRTVSQPHVQLGQYISKIHDKRIPWGFYVYRRNDKYDFRKVNLKIFRKGSGVR